MSNISIEKLEYVFRLFNTFLCEGLCEKTNGKITTLDHCDRDGNGAPVFVDWQLHRQRRHGFYCMGELDGNQYGVGVDFVGTLTENEYAELLNMFAKKYPTDKHLKEIDMVKIKKIFENADRVLNDGLKVKTNGALDLSKCDKDKGAPVFVDHCIHRARRHGFYCWGEVDGIIYGMSYDDIGILSNREYEEVLKIFRQKYPV